MHKWICTIDANFRKKLIGGNKSQKGIEAGCVLMIETLKKILPESDMSIHKFKFPNDNLIDDCRLGLLIEEAIEHFDFCKDLASGEIKENEWSDYSFDGDFVELFNGYTNEFWDICDYICNDKQRYDDNVVKFCWVKL